MNNENERIERALINTMRQLKGTLPKKDCWVLIYPTFYTSIDHGWGYMEKLTGSPGIEYTKDAALRTKTNRCCAEETARSKKVFDYLCTQFEKQGPQIVANLVTYLNAKHDTDIFLFFEVHKGSSRKEIRDHLERLFASGDIFDVADGNCYKTEQGHKLFTIESDPYASPFVDFNGIGDWKKNWASDALKGWNPWGNLNVPDWQ